MKALDFRFLGFASVTPIEWLRQWSSLYPTLAGYDEDTYRDLIVRHRTLTPTDFEQIGRWKDDATSQAKWRPNIASVVYNIWMQASAETPRQPEVEDVAAFLDDWAERASRYVYPGGKSVTKRFGLSRASTLLHFISGGKYPIFDSRVITAVRALLGRAPAYSIPWYLESFCPLIADIAACCETVDYRTVDQALFCYGAFLSMIDPMPHPLREFAAHRTATGK